MVKLYPTFQSPYSLEVCILFHNIFLSVSMWSNLQKHVLFFWMFFCRNSSLTKTTDSFSFLLKTTGSSHCSCFQSHYTVYISKIPSCLLLTNKEVMAYIVSSPSGIRGAGEWFLCYQPDRGATAKLQEPGWGHIQGGDDFRQASRGGLLYHDELLVFSDGRFR